MPRIVQRLEIDAGHRLLNHEGKCRNVHGHRYVFELAIEAPQVDACGRVLDFGEVKRVLGGWLDANLDHGFIAQAGDPIIDFLQQHGQKLSVMSVAPSAENIAEHVFLALRDVCREQLPPAIQLVGLRVWETPNCRAEVGLL